jgi:hypothetical protein
MGAIERREVDITITAGGTPDIGVTSISRKI